MQFLKKQKKLMQLSLMYLGQILEAGERFQKCIKKIRKNIIKKKNIYYRPWGRYVNLFEGKGFLVKELFVKPGASLSLQKHNHREEHWFITHGSPKITVNNDTLNKKTNDSVFIPKGAIHRINNPFKTIVKIIEIQIGSILKESDIIRYHDIYGRVK